MSQQDEDNEAVDDAGVGLSLRERGGLSTYAGLRERAALGARLGWHGEEMPPGMNLGGIVRRGVEWA